MVTEFSDGLTMKVAACNAVACVAQAALVQTIVFTWYLPSAILPMSTHALASLSLTLTAVLDHVHGNANFIIGKSFRC
jgi:hypothetical protein